MRKTKIVATIGPACDAKEVIEKMMEAGVDVFRFNMKHGDMEWHESRLRRVEEVAKKMKQRVGLLIDLQGPEVRLHQVPESLERVEVGQVVKFTTPTLASDHELSLDHPDIFADVKVGQVVYADDGELEFEVIERDEEWFEARVVQGGKVKPRKTVNFPGLNLSFPALIDKDLEHIGLAIKHHVDYVALSYVRTDEDVRVLRHELEQRKIECKIISKIEHPLAVENLEAIVEASDGLMVARGDLGLEYPLEAVPALQKHIVERCREAGKPVIVATQMLESMIENIRPTRAEVSDVANAVYESADAVMLSGESAAGKYPVQAVKIMDRVIRHTQDHVTSDEVVLEAADQTAAVVKAASVMMRESQGGKQAPKAFVLLSETGRTANYLSRLRPNLPILAMSGEEKTLDQLQLVWGVKPVYYAYSHQHPIDVKPLMKHLVEVGYLKNRDRVVMIYGEKWGKPGQTSVVRLVGES